ncbi:cellulose biosynthesis protein BcsQ [Pseudoalteromonas sp.]|uniref:cellulose biosynthesis protein BcsQ n=1 Tax=Pseudoalteromonas sp. TaxID=53249 RepID=UPI001BCF611F|nr:cellulose biosynthesis protein BcsQ [Pseudoalteromonas sp.]
MQRIFIKGIKGGIGSTSVVANLACALRKSNVDVIAIDLDAKSDLGLHFGLKWTTTKGWSNADSFEEALTHFYKDSDGVIFLPFGDKNANLNDIKTIVENCTKLDCKLGTWMLFDCPSHIDISELALETKDILIELVTCDAICHSLIYKRLQMLQNVESNWNHFFLVNRYNAASVLEFDIYSLWQSTLPFIAPFFINLDEVIKESTAHRNVALNCAPYSVANDDFETLAGWLVSKVAF